MPIDYRRFADRIATHRRVFPEPFYSRAQTDGPNALFIMAFTFDNIRNVLQHISSTCTSTTTGVIGKPTRSTGLTGDAATQLLRAVLHGPITRFAKSARGHAKIAGPPPFLSSLWKRSTLNPRFRPIARSTRRGIHPHVQKRLGRMPDFACRAGVLFLAHAPRGRCQDAQDLPRWIQPHSRHRPSKEVGPSGITPRADDGGFCEKLSAISRCALTIPVTQA